MIHSLQQILHRAGPPRVAVSHDFSTFPDPLSHSCDPRDPSPSRTLQAAVWTGWSTPAGPSQVTVVYQIVALHSWRRLNSTLSVRTEVGERGSAALYDGLCRSEEATGPCVVRDVELDASGWPLRTSSHRKCENVDLLTESHRKS